MSHFLSSGVTSRVVRGFQVVLCRSKHASLRGTCSFRESVVLMPCLHNRQCSQTTANVKHRARRSTGQRSKLHVDIVCFSVTFFFEPPNHLAPQSNHKDTRICWSTLMPHVHGFSTVHTCATRLASACHSLGFGCRAQHQRPMRLTSTQEATTRGFMVSRIMGATNIAATSCFVETSLKINCEEWTRVVCQYMVPNSADLMGLAQISRDLRQRAVAHLQAQLVRLQDPFAQHTGVLVSTTVLPRSLSVRHL